MTPEIFKCARCGNDTHRSPGATSQKYCKECAKKAHNEWRKGQKRYVRPVVEIEPPDVRCESCAYWRDISAWKNEKCCHFLLYTGEARERGEEGCLSYSESLKKLYHIYDMRDEQGEEHED